MRSAAHSILVAMLAVLSVIVLGVGTMITSTAFSLAASTALIMGGSGTPNPDLEVGYVPNVLNYYIYPNTSCTAGNCNPSAVVTPEQAWPLYGGLSALTWKESVNQGVTDLDAVVQPQLEGLRADNHLVIFGYSQSGAIASIEKQRLASQLSDEDQQFVEWVITGNASRPNGGLNVRLPITVPIVQFPYGPPTPTDTNMSTDDIALKWDIIADAPLYVTNPLAMLNAFIGGPGFGINHGTYPNPEGDPPTGLVGGYTQDEWQAIMDNPERYAATNPDVVNVQWYGDTRYITVTPRVMPLLVPLHRIGLGFVADLFEPALRDIVEQTGYDRSIFYGQPTTFRLIPIFNPIQLTLDLIADIPEGIQQALNGGPPPLNPPETLTTLTLAVAKTAVTAAEPTETTDLTDNKKSTPKLTLVKETEEQPTVENDTTTASTEDTSHTKADDTKADDTKADDTKADDTKADDTKADDTKADDIKADDTTADDTTADDNKADDNTADDNKADDNKADGTKADDNKADDNTADDNKADTKKADDKADTKKADHKKADDKADTKKADHKKADHKKADEKKADETIADQTKVDNETKADTDETDGNTAKAAA